MARLSPEKLVYTSAFGARDPIKTSAGTTPAFHWGVDYGPEVRGKTGVPLCAVFGGVVTHLADQYGALGQRVTSTAGAIGLDLLRSLYSIKGLVIQEWTTVAISVWHLASRAVANAATVAAGAIIGIMGSTGLSTGVHAHVELTIAGVRVDPKPFLDAQATKPIAQAPSDYPLPERPSWAREVPTMFGIKADDAKGELGPAGFTQFAIVGDSSFLYLGQGADGLKSANRYAERLGNFVVVSASEWIKFRERAGSTRRWH